MHTNSLGAGKKGIPSAMEDDRNPGIIKFARLFEFRYGRCKPSGRGAAGQRKGGKVRGLNRCSLGAILQKKMASRAQSKIEWLETRQWLIQETASRKCCEMLSLLAVNVNREEIPVVS
jgi:hypothetical protein